MNSKHVLQRYWDMILSQINAEALKFAIECKLFDYLEHEQDVQTVATHFDWHHENTQHYLDLLWSMELLVQAADNTCRYQNSVVAQRYFYSQSTEYIGDSFLFRLMTMQQVTQQLPCKLHRDFQPENIQQTVIEKNWAKAARLQIAQEQRSVTQHIAVDIMQSIPEFYACKRLLDLGGGPGYIAIELLKANPSLLGEVFDFPDTTNIATQNIAKAGLASRLVAISGNIIHDSLNGYYDLVWCSSVLHFVPEPYAILQKIYSALNPGGVLVCAHAEMPTQYDKAQRILPYYLAMQMSGRPLFIAGHIAQSLAEIGFCQIEQKNNIDFPVAPVSLIVARKAK